MATVTTTVKKVRVSALPAEPINTRDRTFHFAGNSWHFLCELFVSRLKRRYQSVLGTEQTTFLKVRSFLAITADFFPPRDGNQPETATVNCPAERQARGSDLTMHR